MLHRHMAARARQTMLTVCVLVVLLAGAGASDRRLRVSIQPNSSPATTNFDTRLNPKGTDIDPNDNRVKKQAPRCEQPEQVHLTFWSSTSTLVSWASCDAILGQTYPVSTDGIKSVVYYGTNKNDLSQTAEGVATSYANDYTPVGAGTSYASPVLHHVLLKDLQPGTTYYYKVADTSGSSDGQSKLAQAKQNGKLYSFTLPSTNAFQNGKSVKIGVIGDPGQTYNTSDTLDRLRASNPEVVILLADFVYADNWLSFGEHQMKSYGPTEGTVTFQPKWDTGSRLFEPLLSSVPLMHVNGNHEIEALKNGTDNRNNAYNHRYPTPQLTGHDYNKGPTKFDPVTKDHPFTNLYYSTELPGVYKYIALTSYAPGQTFSQEEEQYKWLQKELQKVDRSKTPWLLIAVHAPWYNTYQGHYKEVECFRQAYEPLLVQYKADLVMAGHVHAYERSKPVVNYQVSEAGPMYITIGDGGNIEGVYKDFVDSNNPPAYCSDPKGNPSKIFPPTYQPQACYSYQNGRFCPEKQPDWSAYREPSFGYGTLELKSPTEATWTWYKNQAPAFSVSDYVAITRTAGRR